MVTVSPATVKTSSPVDLRQGDRAGLDGRTQRRLFQGKFPIDRRIDLHGHTSVRAEIKLQRFIIIILDPKKIKVVLFLFT